MPEYMFISGNSVLQKHIILNQYFLDLRPEVSPSAPEVECQWIALVSSKLYKVVSYFLQKLDVSTIPEYFETLWGKFCFWESISVPTFAYFCLNVGLFEN